MYKIHGFNCQIYGISKSKVPDVLARLEKKYNKSMFGQDMNIMYVFIFRIVNNKYQISLEIERPTSQPVKFRNVQKNEHGSMFRLSADIIDDN